MADAYTSQPEKNETRAEAEKVEQPQSAKFWLNELSAAHKRDEGWIKRGQAVVKRFRDERDSKEYTNSADKRANILWSNTEILKAALFQRLGNPDVRRRFPKKGKDEKDTRTAALVQERALSYSNDDGEYDCEAQVEAAVEDMLLPGRGAAWVVYDAHVAANPETNQEEIGYQSVRDEHVYWEDFRHSAGRKWSDVWWVGRCHYYTRDELIQNFGEEHGSKVPLNCEVIDSTKDKSKDDDTFKRSRTWEIWDKNQKKRVYVAEDYHTVIKTDDDPYRLKRFFPCPEPMFGVKTTSSMVPVPEFTLYQDQADELDEISTRLTVHIKNLKRRGVYDGSLEGPDNQLSQLAFAGDNQFFPFRGFAGLMEKGGLANVFQAEDLKPTIAVIEGLYKRADVLIQTIYTVTGISDVMRGANAKEQTATEIRVKGQFGSMRLQKRQNMVQRFIRDLARIKAEIISEHFTRDTLQEMTGIDMPTEAEKQQAEQALASMHQALQMAAQQQQQPQPGVEAMGANGGPPMDQPPMPQIQQPDPEHIKSLEAIVAAPSWEAIESILRSDQRRGYKVDVETDQTAMVDEQEEKNSRVEFMNAITVTLEKLVPLLMQNPATLPLFKESVMFVVKGFKAGRPLEESFEDTFDKMEKQAAQQAQQGPPVDPVAKAKAEEIQVKTQASQQKHQADMAMAQQKMAGQQELQKMDMTGKVMDIQGKQMDLQMKREEAQIDRAIKIEETQLQREEMQRDAEVKGWEDYYKLENSQQQAAFDRKSQEQDMRLSQAERVHKMKLAEKKATQPQAQ
jgi:hypothetical protein